MDSNGIEWILEDSGANEHQGFLRVLVGSGGWVWNLVDAVDSWMGSLFWEKHVS